MTLAIGRREHRDPVSFVMAVLGGSLIAVGGVLAAWLWYASMTEARDAYQYTITQAQTIDVRYRENSFFDDSVIQNNAYISQLTDTIDTSLQYKYDATRAADVTLTYDVTAAVHGQYALTGNTDGSSDVWSQRHVLVSQSTEVVHGTQASLAIPVTIPFTDYRQEVEQLSKGIDLSLSGEVVVTTTVRAQGTIDGVKLDDKRQATVTIPLDQPVYMLATNVEKTASGTLSANVSHPWHRNSWPQVVAVLAIVVGVGLVVMTFRRPRSTSSYQRELNKIYRYHEGIIVRASTPTDITGKQVVAMHSFDDMLNLEEELKSPIIANPAGPEATIFMVVRDDIVYQYTLGRIDPNVSRDLDSAVRSIKASQRRRQ